MSAAADLAERVRRHGRIFVPVTQLLDAYGQDRLTDDVRASLDEQLAQAGIVADPPLARVHRREAIRLQLVDHEPKPEAWTEKTLGSVRWIDLDADAEADAAKLGEVVGHPLTTAQVDELLRPNAHPQLERHDGVLKISTVELFADEPSDDQGTPTGQLRAQSLELVVGPTWLLSCWHHPLTGEPVQRPASFGEGFDGDSAAALAATLLDRLACGYGPAIATVDAWLQQWEYSLDREQAATERHTLREVRDLVGRLFRQLGPLEEVLDELNELWPKDTHLAHAHRRTANALRALDRLAGRLASAFALLATHDAEARREQSQRLEDRLTLATAILLVPTLIASIYGVNVNLPGKDSWSGFIEMLLLMVVGAAVSLYLFRRTRPSQGPSDSPAAPTSGSASSQP